MINLFSTTKGLSALAVAHGHSRGLFEYDEPVATYWPEFAANGKHQVTVRTLLSHQAGLCAIDASMAVATLADPDAAAAAIGPQKPAWTPGEQHGYHAVTLGWYESELIRRTDPQHRTIGRYFAEEIAAPLGLDLYIGLPDEVPEERLARFMGDWYRVKMLFHMRTMPRRFVKNFLDPRSITARSFANPKVVGDDVATTIVALRAALCRTDVRGRRSEQDLAEINVDELGPGVRESRRRARSGLSAASRPLATERDTSAVRHPHPNAGNVNQSP